MQLKGLVQVSGRVYVIIDYRGDSQIYSIGDRVGQEFEIVGILNRTVKVRKVR
jgi:hypothetical protein